MDTDVSNEGYDALILILNEIIEYFVEKTQTAIEIFFYKQIE